MAVRSLLIPVVVNQDGDVLWVEETVKGGIYRCPSCSEQLVRRGGAGKVVLHFAHTRETSCSGETALHAAAKRMALKSVTNWLEGKANPPVLVGGCMGVEVIYQTPDAGWGDGWSCSAQIELPLLNERVDACREEVELTNGLRPDLTLFRNEKPVLAVEIKVTHEVCAQKGAQMGVTWIELDAEAVIRDPLVWRPLKHNVNKLKRCAFCNQVDTTRMLKAIREEVSSWIGRWRSKHWNGPLVRYEMGYRRGVLMRLVNEEVEVWTRKHGRKLPGEIRYLG